MKASHRSIIQLFCIRDSLLTEQTQLTLLFANRAHGNAGVGLCIGWYSEGVCYKLQYADTSGASLDRQSDNEDGCFTHPGDDCPNAILVTFEPRTV